MDTRRAKWWGWGFEDRSLPLDSRPRLAAYLRGQLGPLEPDPLAVPPLEGLEVPESRLTEQEMERLRHLVGEAGVCLDRTDRIAHAQGRSYRDLVRIRLGRIPPPPDAVIYPDDEAAVLALLREAPDHAWAVVPFGGGSNVVGGVDPRVAGEFAAVLTVDLRRMRRLIDLDLVSRTATFEAGIRGPLLEEELGRHGLTLGHVPQSFEFSTLGGWIATRSAGAFSNEYGKIEDLVVSLRLATPRGLMETGRFDRHATGPDLREFAIGSEGTIGIVTSATVHVHPLPPVRAYGSRLFRTFDEGLDVLRALAQLHALPSATYLSDESETAFNAAAADPVTGLRAGGLRVLGARGLTLHHGSLLLMGWEGTTHRVSHLRRMARRLCRRGASLGSGPTRTWMRERFELPYLRDSLIERRILIDTVETAARWSDLRAVYDTARRAITEAIWKQGFNAIVLCHVSHVYPGGASLYFTFFTRQRRGSEIEQWEDVRDAAVRAFVSSGGLVSHHHGVGVEHRTYLTESLDPVSRGALLAVKRSIDPKGIMNPGKLLEGEE